MSQAQSVPRFAPFPARCAVCVFVYLLKAGPTADTRPPLDLYCFYLFLQREGAEDTLDFWLDVQQHENLARAYFKDLLKALPLAPSQSPSERQRESAKQIEADWPRYAHYAKTRGSIYNRFTGIEEGDNTSYREYQQELEKKGSDGEHSSAGHESLSGGGEKEWRGGQRTGYDEQLDQEEKLGQGNDYDRVPSPNPSAYPLSPNLRPLYPHEQDPSSLSSGTDSQRRISSPFLRNAKSNQPAAQPFIKRDIAISRSDLISSAERIFSRYLMPGADKEIYLPPALRLTSFPLSSSTLPPPDHPDYELEAAAQAEVPDMFHKQKEFVYSQLKEESFPRFLRAKGFGNLTRMSSVVRLAIGLGALWAGLATAFAFIFLATEPRSTRLWVSHHFSIFWA